MADHLTEVESLCQRILQELERQTSSYPGKIDGLRKRLQDLLPVIAESKKKIMVRSARGQKLTKEVLDNASKLYEAASLSSEDGSGLDEVDRGLEKVEDGVKKLEIYWKSFEYATT